MLASSLWIRHAILGSYLNRFSGAKAGNNFVNLAPNLWNAAYHHEKNEMTNTGFLEEYFPLSGSDLAEVDQWECDKIDRMCCDQPKRVQFTYNWMITTLFIKRNAFRVTGLNPLSHIVYLFICSPCDRQAIGLAEICEAAPSQHWKTRGACFIFALLPAPVPDVCLQVFFTQ